MAALWNRAGHYIFALWFLSFFFISSPILSGRTLDARCNIHFASKSCVRLYWQRYCTALQQLASAKVCGVVQGMELQNFRRRRHLYSAGRSSRWASAHILVNYYCHFCLCHLYMINFCDLLYQSCKMSINFFVSVGMFSIQCKLLLCYKIYALVKSSDD